MEMRLRTPVTRGYFFLLGALRLVNAASPRNTDQKKISSGTQGILSVEQKTIVGNVNLASNVTLIMRSLYEIIHICTAVIDESEK